MTSPTYANTPSRLIEYAMRDAGYLQEGELPNSDQIATNFNRLTSLINLWQIKGLKLWVEQDIPITMIAGTSLYTLGPTGTVPMVKPLRIPMAYVVNSSGISRPLIPLAREDWITLSTRTQQGAINSYFIDKQQLTLNVNLWLTPDATAALDTLHLVTQTQITNPISLTENLNFPPEWFIALEWGLADDICTGQPEAIMNRCAQKAKAYREALEDWDVEDASTSFTVNTQGMSPRGFA